MLSFREWVDARAAEIQAAGTGYAAILVEPDRTHEGSSPSKTGKTSNRGTQVVQIDQLWERGRNEPLFALLNLVGPTSPVHEILRPGEVPHGPIIIGRTPPCDVTLKDMAVSLRHAMIRFTAQGPTLRDLVSSNGTFINREPVGSDPLPIQSMDCLRFGPRALYFLEGKRLVDFVTFWNKRPG